MAIYVGDDRVPEGLSWQGYGLKVTPLAVVTPGGRSIATANIAAATVETVPAARAPGIVVALVGIVVGGACLASGGESQAVGLVFGGVSLVVGLTMAALAHERHAVHLELVGGRGRQALGCRDQEEALEAAATINRAAAWARGRPAGAGLQAT
jgi:hypothetical protein